MQGLVNKIRDLTRRDLLPPAAPLPGAPSQAESLPGAVTEPSSGGVSPPFAAEHRPKQVDFRKPCAGYSEKWNRYAQQKDSSDQRRHPACCHVADGHN